MREEENFIDFIKRTVITFWAYAILLVMFFITAVIISYSATIVYKHLANKEYIIINPPM